MGTGELAPTHHKYVDFFAITISLKKVSMTLSMLFSKLLLVVLFECYFTIFFN
jgi:hypothetical protein